MDYSKLYEGMSLPAPIEEAELPDTDDLKELAESAIPGLVRRAITLAQSSNRLPDVMSVLNAMLDRVHGKPHQAVEHSGKVQFEQLIIQRSQPTLPIIEVKDGE